LPKINNKIMYTTYHLPSAQDVNMDILNAIKSTYKSSPITITIEEEMDTTAYLMSTQANRALLEKSLLEAKNGQFITVEIDE
jgi:hypothetical protein